MISLGTTLLCDLRLPFFVPLDKSKNNKVSIHEVAFCFLRCDCKCLFKFSLMTYSAPFCAYDKIRPLESTGIQCIYESREMPRRSRREDRAKGMPVQPVFIPQKKGKKPSDTVETVEIPKGDQASESFKCSVVKEMIKSGLAVRQNVSKK